MRGALFYRNSGCFLSWFMLAFFVLFGVKTICLVVQIINPLNYSVTALEKTLYAAYFHFVEFS